MNPPGYDYALFCANVEAIHGRECWIHRLLTNRDGRTVPFDWLLCDGVKDGHHVVIPKRLLKYEFPHGAVLYDADAGVWRKIDPRVVYERETDPPRRTLGELMNDGRNGVPVCRRHHDMVEGRQLVIRRDELPPEAVEFSTELGLEWYLDSRVFDPPLVATTNGGRR